MLQLHQSHVSLLLIIGLVVLLNTTEGLPVIEPEEKTKLMNEIDDLDKQLRYTCFVIKFKLKLNKILMSLSQHIINRMLKHPSRNKRSDIDERLFDLQAKILLTKAYANYPAGHGKFNFDDM